ncbi:ABC transporter ATP-binding protein [Streptomyces sp. YIM 98790]|uniref:ABC transporter ATP-binding protein n=1 Tax=Streptomyces sp. YIM 98790 TaxID=2689077 RepID=UPI00140B6D13|nr:ABC transporter ATP-binding protein [Streptomyces sp. YIM 98790]
MTDLRISGLTKSYRRPGRPARPVRPGREGRPGGDPDAGRPVLDGLDLAVESGELTAVLGPSGCGKTTLLRIVAGFLAADAGTVAVGGRTVTGDGVHIPPEKRAIGIVAQEGALFPHLTVARNVAFGLGGPRGSGLDRAARRHRVAGMLELVGLAGMGDRMPHQLSGGQQQRVALARALAPRPALVLLDEPFNALDSALRTGLRADVRAALRATGATALLVTHDQQEALSTADRIAVLRDGRVAQYGTPEEVYQHPADTWVAGFVGDAVLVPGRAAGDGGTAAETPLGSIPLRHATGGGTGTGTGNGPGTVILRPEQLVLCPPGAGSVHGTVTDICYFGHDTVVSVSVPGLDTAVDVRHPGPVPVRRGEPTGLAVTGAAVLRSGPAAG